MLEMIVERDSHTLFFDPAKNRLYLTITGKYLPGSSTFVQDWKKARYLVSPGFTVLTDVSQIQPLPLDWIVISTTVQELLIEVGLTGTAEILSESMVAEKQVNTISWGSGIKKRVFTKRKAAEVWLDSISA